MPPTIGQSRNSVLRSTKLKPAVPFPQKIVPSPRKFTEDPLCDVQEPSERSGHTCGTSLESSMLRNKIVIVERHCLIACIPLGADEPCIVWDAQIFRDQELADSWAVGHLCECTRVGPTAPPPQALQSWVIWRSHRPIEVSLQLS